MLFINDNLAKSHHRRHPGEPRIRSGAGAGVQTPSRRKPGTIQQNLDSDFRRNDEKERFLTFYESTIDNFSSKMRIEKV
jgi:hypothetical protein